MFDQGGDRSAAKARRQERSPFSTPMPNFPSRHEVQSLPGLSFSRNYYREFGKNAHLSAKCVCTVQHSMFVNGSEKKESRILADIIVTVYIVIIT
ncbi:hypothetical protein NPIL_327281 [Nephila pilipes]|uniref:Uncharacterized protein n=1 Tax=Nephila pilipes TaxID=299642 RepID=A0A8X6NWT8_NEPPI|nr:hypothetical protein NPIL_327281 [Nephila pilipes]